MARVPRFHGLTDELPHTFRAFRHHDYRLLWPANVLSYTSRWMQMTLLSWMVLELTDSPLLVALVGFFGMAPMFLLGLVGGVLADTVDRRRLLMTTQAASLLAATVMTVLLVFDSAVYWHAYATAATVGAAWALDMPSRRSALHDLLGDTGVTNAVALDSMGMSFSVMVGPALAGALITLVGIPGGYVVVTCCYLISVALLSRLRLSKAKRVTSNIASMSRNLSVGLRYVSGHRTLLATVFITVLMNLLMYPYRNMVPVIARDVLHVGPALMGLLQSAAGLGAMVGAVVVASRVNVPSHGRIYVGGTMVAMAALLVFSLSRWYFASLATLVVLGLGTAAFSTMQATIVMLAAKPELRGAALGVTSLAIGAGPFGALFIGMEAVTVSTSFAIGLNAAIGLTLVGLVWLFMPSLRWPIVRDAPG